MRKLTFTTKFKKDLNRLKKQGKDPEKLFVFVQLLLDEGTIPPQYKDHGLVGEWKHCRECHVDPDWLLIYSITPEEIIAHRTGSHAELFGK